MRTFPFCIAIVAAAAMAGCTVKNTTVKRAETPPAVVYQQPPAVVYQAPPTVSGTPTIRYTVMGQQQYDQAAVQAASWCSTNHYGPGARLIDRQRSTAGDVVTFQCAAG